MPQKQFWSNSKDINKHRPGNNSLRNSGECFDLRDEEMRGKGFPSNFKCDSAGMPKQRNMQKFRGLFG